MRSWHFRISLGRAASVTLAAACASSVSVVSGPEPEVVHLFFGAAGAASAARIKPHASRGSPMLPRSCLRASVVAKTRR